jgi:hypothetical protein
MYGTGSSGFLREMLMAPVSRMSLVSVTGFGKPG